MYSTLHLKFLITILYSYVHIYSTVRYLYGINTRIHYNKRMSQYPSRKLIWREARERRRCGRAHRWWRTWRSGRRAPLSSSIAASGSCCTWGDCQATLTDLHERIPIRATGFTMHNSKYLYNSTRILSKPINKLVNKSDSSHMLYRKCTV